MAQEKLEIGIKQLLYWLIAAINIYFVFVNINGLKHIPFRIIPFDGLESIIPILRAYIFMGGILLNAIFILAVALFFILQSLETVPGKTPKSIGYLILLLAFLLLISRIIGKYGGGYMDFDPDRLLHVVLNFLRNNLYIFIFGLFSVNYLLSVTSRSEKYDYMKIIYLVICILSGISLIITVPRFFRGGFNLPVFLNLIEYILFIVIAVYEFIMIDKRKIINV